MEYFKDYDFTNFWQPDDEDYKREEYPGDEAIKEIENQIGFKIPESYLWLMKQHNGGKVSKNTMWLDELFCVQFLSNVDGVLSYSPEKDNSKIGVLFATGLYDGPNHYIFDYRTCTENEEPSVAYLDLEIINDDFFEITKVANNFEEFITSIVFGEEPEEPESANKYKKLRQLLGIIFFCLTCVLFLGGFIMLLADSFLGFPGIVLSFIVGCLWVVIDDKLEKL